MEWLPLIRSHCHGLHPQTTFKYLIIIFTKKIVWWEQSKVPNFLHKGLKPATTYSYTVEAVDTAGNKSERSAILSLKTNDETEGQLPVPSVPLQLTAKNILQNKLTLTWVKKYTE